MKQRMKKLLCFLISLAVLASLPVIRSFGEEKQAMLQYDFDSSVPALYGAAATQNDTEKGSRVLQLDGSEGAYAALPAGALDGKDALTVMFDVKPAGSNGNFFTFAIGADSNAYSFIRFRGNEVREAITVGSYTEEREVKATAPYTDGWLHIALVIENTAHRLYINGELKGENADTGLRISDLGTNLKVYFGKSFYDGDAYYKGSFDNVAVYDAALTQEEIAAKITLQLPLLVSMTAGTLTGNLSSQNGTDSHTAVFTQIDRENGTIIPYIKKAQNAQSVPLTVCVTGHAAITLDGAVFRSGDRADLSYQRTLKLTAGGRSETYRLQPAVIAANPVLPGQYADPDIAVLDGKFWIFPTTDGTAGWAGTQFHAFSSSDLVNWTDEGVILDVKETAAKTNARGVTIAVSPWSDINAWAPAVAEKGGKYYFYYCSNIAPAYTEQYGSGMAIGVAVASKPQGPYTALSRPLVYPKLTEEAGIGFAGQTIDPSVFIDDDGTAYLLFGNGSAAYAVLGSDMMSLQTNSLHLMTGLDGFRESVTAFKRGNKYYFTWSCDDTGSENYHVNYGISSAFGQAVTNLGTILEKDPSLGILGTGHQSVLYLKGSDKCFIAYHRFYTPLGQIGDGFGFHRETCIDTVTFKSDFRGDRINVIHPSHTGTGRYDVCGNRLPDTPTVTTTAKPTTTKQKKVTVKKTAIVKLVRGTKSFKVKWKKVSGVTGYQVQYALNAKFTKGRKTVRVKGAKTVTKTVKKLKKKKKYYVRVRAYKTVKKKTYYASWSKKRSVTVR